MKVSSTMIATSGGSWRQQLHSTTHTTQLWPLSTGHNDIIDLIKSTIYTCRVKLSTGDRERERESPGSTVTIKRTDGRITPHNIINVMSMKLARQSVLHGSGLFDLTLWSKITFDSGFSLWFCLHYTAYYLAFILYSQN